MTTWDDITAELAVWRAEGLDLPVWWRDDDAIAPTKALDRLHGAADHAEVPVHLAIIPETASHALAQTLSATETLIPVTHGWSHQNHAPQGVKKAEFGDHRDARAIARDLSDSFNRMADLFGRAATDMFVPPWNRIGEEAAQIAGELGFGALSTFTPRRAERRGRLHIINTHIDPIDWHGTRSCLPETQICAHLLAILQARRAGVQNNTEPLGLLTHHLVHDDAIWQFVDRYWETLRTGPIRVWALDELERIT